MDELEQEPIDDNVVIDEEGNESPAPRTYGLRALSERLNPEA